MPTAKSNETIVNIFDYRSMLSDEDTEASPLAFKQGIDIALHTSLNSGVTVIITTENLANEVVDTFNTQVGESLPSIPSNSATMNQGTLFLYQSTMTQRKLLVSVHPCYLENLFLQEHLIHIIDYLTAQEIRPGSITYYDCNRRNCETAKRQEKLPQIPVNSYYIEPGTKFTPQLISLQQVTSHRGRSAPDSSFFSLELTTTNSTIRRRRTSENQAQAPAAKPTPMLG